MIGGVLEVIRTAVLAPQESAVDPDERVYLDPDSVPLNVQPATGEVVALTTTPINPEIGSGIINLRHMAVLVVTIEGADREYPGKLRDTITTALLRRAVLVDWVNTYIAPDQQVIDAKVNVEYSELESEQLAAYVSLVFTVDVEWTV